MCIRLPAAYYPGLSASAAATAAKALAAAASATEDDAA
jgi:hypothetical protein